MNGKNTGGPAFGQVVELRCVRVDPTGSTEWEPALAQGGMTLRDYFAAKAMQGELAALNGSDGVGCCGIAWDASDETFNNHAEHFYRIADAMLKAREA